MSKKNKKNMNKTEEQQEIIDNQQHNVTIDEEPANQPTVEVDDENTDEPEAKTENGESESDADVQVVEEDPVQMLEDMKKSYLYLMAEFDNFRKRTLHEKQELIKNGSARVLEQLLPVVDDFERALDAIEKSNDVEAIKEGVDLIYNKFIKYLKQQNVEAIKSNGELFDTDLHEAVTTFPTQDEEQKGKVIDTVLKGYKINDKVLRHAKVVVGA